ncbi:MAG: tandem-95 repeat protein, partial [Anaerolineae bacterium]|nr:tandem-95 repeat protein [Anaerolineae bacterium]
GGTAPYSFQVSGTPTGGTVSGTAPNLTFTPDAGFSGTGEVLYRVQDATGMVTRGRVRVMVAPDLISPPRPVNAVPGQPVNLTLTASGGREPYTFSNLSRPANGTLTGTAPDLTFTPANGFSSSTSFTFTVTDANGDTVTGRANITVARLAAASRTLTLLAGQDVALSLTATGGIPPYRFRQLTTPVGGVLVGQSPALRYLANGNFSGVETLSFEAQDSQDTTVTFTITITVNRPAATIPVTTTAMETPLVNNGNCTLLEALLAAHNNSAVDACPAGSTGMDVVELPAGLFNIQVNPVDTWVGNGSRLTLRGAGTEQTVIWGYYDRPFMTTWLSSSETIFTGISFEGWPRGIVDGTGSVTLDTVRVNTAGARMRTAMVRMPGGEPGRLTVRNSIFISRDLESFQPALLTRDPVVTTITGSAFSMTYDIMRVSHATLTHNCLLGLYPNRFDLLPSVLVENNYIAGSTPLEQRPALCNPIMPAQVLIPPGDTAALARAIREIPYYDQMTIVLAAGSTYSFAAPDDRSSWPAYLAALPRLSGNFIVEGNGATLTRTGSEPFRLLVAIGSGTGTGTGTFRNLTLENGHSQQDGGAMYLSSGQFGLENVTFRQNRSDNEGEAVAVEHISSSLFTSTSLTVVNSFFEGNGDGLGQVLALGGQDVALDITGSQFRNNPAEALLLPSSVNRPVQVRQTCFMNGQPALPQRDWSTGTVLNLTGNWWHAADGPSGSGPGSGDSVPPGVTFSPYLTEPPAHCQDLQVPDITQAVVSESPVALVLRPIGGRAPLTYSLTPPTAGGTVTGTAPNLTFTPAANFVGVVSFTYTVTDANNRTDTGTVTLDVLGQGVITVTSTAQEVPFVTNGNCTLGEAIHAANTSTAVDACPAGRGLDVIRLQNATYTLQNFHTADASTQTGLPIISSNMVIEGGSGTVIQRAADAPQFRLLLVNSAGSLTLRRLTLRGGSLSTADTTFGGAISAAGPLTLDSVTISDSSAFYGGAISFIASDGTVALNISNSTFTGHEARQGGALFVCGTTSITGSTFSDNTANIGGALVTCNDETMPVTITGSHLVNNVATQNPTQNNPYGGGSAIFSMGGRISITGSVLRDTPDSTLTLIDTSKANMPRTNMPLTITGSCVIGHSIYGLQMHLEDNWWGSSSGAGGFYSGHGTPILPGNMHPFFITTYTRFLTASILGCPVQPVRPQPQTLTTPPHVPLNLQLTAIDGRPPYTFTVIAPPANGTLSGTPPALTYVADSGTDYVTFQVRDAAGNVAEASITIHVPLPLRLSLPDLPLLPGTSSLPLNHNLPANLLLPVEGGVGPFTAVIVTAPQQGTATLAPQTDALRLTYTPAAGFSGRDTLSVRVTDALGSSTALVVPLEVLPPVAVLDQQYRTAMGRPITVRPQLQHVVPALLPAATYYTVAPVGQPARGRLLIFNGVWTYFPPAGYLGTDTLQYRVSGPGGVLSVATITVEIVTLAALNPVSAPPVSLTTAPGVPITFSLTAAGGNTPYTFTLLTEPAHGTLSGTAPLFTYRSTGTTSVIETLRYRVTDSVGRTAENEISIDVREPLQAAALSVVALQAQTLPLKPPIRGGTPPYDLSIVVPPEQGELLETADGWLYIPGANFTGSEMIVYEVADADLDRDNSTIRITVAPLLLTAPANLALLPTTRPTFTWGAVTGIRSYVVQIAAEPDFATLAWQGVVNGTGYTLPQSLAQGRYFWRVAPLQSGVTQRWSPLAEFNIFIGTAPAAGAVHIGTTPVFTWQAVPGVRQYRLLVSADAQLTDPVVDITTTATTFRPPALAHGLYYWQVVPVDQTPLAGAVRRLLLTPPLPAAPVPSAPAAAALTAETRPELVWAAVTGAAEYELEVTAGSSFTRQPEVTTRVNALRYRLPALAAGAYSWRVRAINVFGAAGAWSAGRVFTIDTTPPAAPVLSSPAEAAIHNGVRPALTWTAAAEAVAFDVLLTTGATSTCEGTPVRVGNVRTYTPPAPLRQGLYRWCVRGYDAAGNAGPWSSPRTLTLNLLNSPADASVVTGTAPAVRFSWLAVPGVAAYTLQIARDADFSSAVTYTPGNVTAHTVVISGGEGLVYWRVTPAGSPPAAHAWRLNVTLVAPGRVALVGPANAFLTREQPTLRWNAVSGIERYEVQIARNSLFTAAVLPVQVSGLTLTTEMLPDGPLWWRVRALSAAGVPGAWSETRSLTLDTTPPAAPLPLAPAAGGVHQGLRPMLSWSAPAEVRRFEVILNAGTTCTAAPVSVNVSPYTAPAGLAQGLHAWCVRGYDAAGNAGPWSSPRLVTLSLLNAPAHQAVVVLPAGQTSARVTLTWLPVPGSTRFTVQVSPQPDLSNPTVYEVTGTSVVVTLPAGHYTWQVLPAGVAPADQVTRHFSVTPRLLAAPALLEPVSALLTRQPQTALRWSAVTGAQRYEVQLAGDATFTRAVRLLPADMPGLTLSHSSDGVVYWRVRGIDTWGAAGVWSAARTLTVDTTPPGVPVLLTPAAGSLLTTRTPAFTWQAAPGAAGYVIEIAADAGFQQTLVRARLSATQFTVPPALALRSGRHYWRVQAVDAAGNSSPVSVVGRFSIP